MQAAQAPWSGNCDFQPTAAPVAQRAPGIAPWYGGLDILFLKYAGNGRRSLVARDSDALPVIRDVDLIPGSDVGFEAYLGRYLASGAYGFDVRYFHFEPGAEMVNFIAPTPAAYRVSIPAFNGVSLDPGTGVDTVYNHFDGASGYRARRDVSFNGIEANLNCFGILGARRVGACGNGGFLANRLRSLFRTGVSSWGPAGCASSGCADGYSAGCASGGCASAPGYARPRGGYFGGAGGPLARACGGRMQVVNSHGFRWFRFNDEFQLAADLDAVYNGYQATDLFYDLETENNLYGYQFGSRLHYCLSNRWLASLGGKAGVYANDVRFRQRLGTQTTLAYVTTAGTDDVYTEDNDTALAFLGEFDLGIGYRVNNACTIRGGYRIMGISGVATTTGHLAEQYSSLQNSSYANADDSVVLHGAYVGAHYNY